MAPITKKKQAPSLAAQTGRISLKDELSLLDDVAPRDFDPEALEDNYSESEDADSEVGSENEAGESENAGREHYVAVGKSKLRKPEPVPLDPKYKGARVSRDELFTGDFESGSESESEDATGSENISEDDNDEDAGVELHSNEDHEMGDSDQDGLSEDDEEDEDEEIDSDNAFGESDEDKHWAKFKFKGSKITKEGVVPSKGYKVTVSDGDDEDEYEKLSGNEEKESAEFKGFASDSDAQEDDEEDEDELDDGEYDDEDEDEDEDDGNESDASNSDSDTSDKALLQTLATDDKTTQASLTSAAHLDVQKGNAVRTQQSTFDNLLGVRIKLQKALVAANTLPLIPNSQITSAISSKEDSWKDAEEAAVKLWNMLRDMRQDINAVHVPPNPKKRKHAALEAVDASTPLETLSDQIAALDNAIQPWRISILDKWAVKTKRNNGASAAAMVLPASSRLNNQAYTPQESLSSKITEQLTSDPERFIKRARIPRSCAPVQQQNILGLRTRSGATTATNGTTPSIHGVSGEDPTIYDDTDFYQTLLRTLVDQRMVNSSATTSSVTWTASTLREAQKSSKTRKIVDTKASKGRKLRYTVHEKLQNFMAPEKRGGGRWWQESQIDELFGSLLGQKPVGSREIDGEKNDRMERDVDMVAGEDGFTLFG